MNHSLDCRYLHLFMTHIEPELVDCYESRKRKVFRPGARQAIVPEHSSKCHDRMFRPKGNGALGTNRAVVPGDRAVVTTAGVTIACLHSLDRTKPTCGTFRARVPGDCAGSLPHVTIAATPNLFKTLIQSTVCACFIPENRELRFFLCGERFQHPIHLPLHLFLTWTLYYHKNPFHQPSSTTLKYSDSNI